MARTSTFFLPADRWPGAPGEGCVLDGPEAHHLLQVLRAPVGAAVRLFDGQGREGLFRVAEASRKAARLVAEKLDTWPRDPGGLVLAAGFGRAARRDLLLEKSVELGARGLVFWQAARTQGRQPEEPKAAWADKLIAAGKQCERLWLPELKALPDLPALLSFAQSFARRILLYEAAGAERLLTMPDLDLDSPVLVAVGPEGGLTAAEAEAFSSAGFLLASLGRSILRWETAALLALSMGYMAGQERAGRERREARP